MSEAARIKALRRELVDRLAEITSYAEALSLDRCPYRTTADACTFTYGCRNSWRDAAGVHCAGAKLNSAPADTSP